MSPCPILHPRQTILGCNNHLLVETCRMCRDPSSPVCVWQGKSGVQGPLRKNNNHFTSSPPPHCTWKAHYNIKHCLPTLILKKQTNFEVKADDVNGDDCFSSKILQSSSQESLWKEKSGNPKDRGNSIINPALDEFHSFLQIQHPGSQWFERGISLSYVWV